MKSLFSVDKKKLDKFYMKNSVFVDSGFVKTCDELVIGPVRVPSQFKSYAKIDDIPQRRR